jgi:hypothetical protein
MHAISLKGFEKFRLVFRLIFRDGKIILEKRYVLQNWTLNKKTLPHANERVNFRDTAGHKMLPRIYAIN